MSNASDLKYLLALGMIPGIGGILSRFLISYAGSAEQVFKLSPGRLLKIPKIGEKTAKAILASDHLARAEEEIAWCEREGIRIISYLDKDYPQRLCHYQDAPLALYVKGNVELNPPRIISVIGTRHASEYGRLVTEQIVEHLQPYGVTILSGLALGIDIAAHRAAVKHGMSTIGVLGHGLDTVYPWQHKSVAQKMLDKGGLISEFSHGTKPDRGNFPQRNRIVAGLGDATIVIESAESGGAMITAEMAVSYHKEVFAVPGRWGDEYSSGCIKLVKENKAHLLSSPADICKELGWTSPAEVEVQGAQVIQRTIFEQLEGPEQVLVACMSQGQAVALDQLHYLCDLPLNTISSALLALEFKGLVKSLPGKRFCLQ